MQVAFAYFERRSEQFESPYTIELQAPGGTTRARRLEGLTGNQCWSHRQSIDLDHTRVTPRIKLAESHLLIIADLLALVE